MDLRGVVTGVPEEDLEAFSPISLLDDEWTPTLIVQGFTVIDGFLSEALARGLPIEVMKHGYGEVFDTSCGPDGGDPDGGPCDDPQETSRIIQAALDFVIGHLQN